MEFPYTHGLQLHPDGSVKSVGDVNNFCCQLNHDGTTAQLNGQLDSCWDIIAKKYADHGVMPPPPGQHPGSPPSTVALEELVWQPMASTTRTLFFAGNDPCNLANSDALSFVKNVLSNLRDVTQPAWPVDAELRIFDKQYADATDGNQSLLSMIDFFRNATRASRNNVIWISGTVEPAFHDADNLGTQLRRNRIRFHSIIPATSKGVRSSYELSQRSHGSLRVLVSLDPKLEALHLGSQLLATAVESVEHFAVLENESFCLRGTRVPLAQDAPSAVHHSSWMRGRISPLRAELPTLIESDAEAVVFGFLNREGDQVQYSVLLPDGKRVPIAEIQGAVRVSPPHSGLTAVIIDHPQPGSWVMIAERFDDENRHATGNLFCAVRNRQLLAVLSVTRMASLSIEIEAVAVADTELIHLEPAFAIVEFLKNDGNWETRHIAQLLPQNPSMVERGGDLVAVVRVLCSGTYRISTRLTNLGNARGTPGTEPGVELSLDSVASNAPVFTRLLQKVVAID